MKATPLVDRKSKPVTKGMPALKTQEIRELLGELDGWKQSKNVISRTIKFKNYYETMAFVNAVAFISHQEDHHPDMEVCYNQCMIHYSTHSVGGISENDFICAAKVDALIVGT